MMAHVKELEKTTSHETYELNTFGETSVMFPLKCVRLLCVGGRGGAYNRSPMLKRERDSAVYSRLTQAPSQRRAHHVQSVVNMTLKTAL